ncbi:MAG TPA: hypothetical protein P5277_05285 [Candidatus Paceibacterota bacterium]|nr:hypothetical protein [Candidatus Paceibacterota bacterium]
MIAVLKEFFFNNWYTVVTTIAIPIAWIFGGKEKQKVELKKSNADAVSTMQSVYDQFLEDYKTRMNEVMLELVNVREHNKSLQNQFNDIQLQYAKEIETSQNWEKLHRELKGQYIELEKHYITLQKDHDKLKKEFEQYKKQKL